MADALGDVDGYISQQSAKAKTLPHISAEIALRLLAVNRAPEALVALDAADLDRGA